MRLLTAAFLGGGRELPSQHAEPTDTLLAGDPRCLDVQVLDGEATLAVVVLGDVGSGAAVVHRGVAEVLGSARPFLDVRYAGPIFSDGFESGDTSAWDGSTR